VLVRLLGPVEVVVDGAVRTPSGKRERALVALLALTPGETVTLESVAAGLWGGLVAPGAALEALVDRVRAESTGPALESSDAGLRLVVEAADVDAVEFERLVTGAREQPPDAALEALDQALSMWRGPALSGVEDVPFAREAAERLGQTRTGALEERFEQLLRLGRHAEAVEELRAATAEHPTRERLWAQLMTALHVEHRSQDALEVYAEARAVLADELGIEPGEALQRIEAAILKDDAGRRDPELADQAVPREAARLPVPGTPTFGRDELVDSIVRSLDDPDARLVTLIGLGGSGKTRAATVAAARWRDGTGRDVHFHLVTERETADDVVAAVESLVGELDPDVEPDQRPLVVLDNVDACPEGSEAVSRLLDELPALRLLVTSRVPLRRRSEQTIAVAPLDVPEPGASAAEIQQSPAVQMFLRIARQADPGLDVTGHEQALAEVCRMLDGVPLALELAAARLRLVGMDGLLESLETGLELLRTTAPDVPDRQRAMATTIAWSHDRLGEGARQLCRRLVIFEQAFTLEAVEAVAADVGDVIELLTQVMEAGLIRPLIGRVRIGFVMPVTVRTYVRRLIVDQRENDPARLALATYLLDHVTRWQDDLDRADGPLALGRFLDIGLDVHTSIEANLRLGRIDEGVALTLASGPFWVASGELRQGLNRTVAASRYVAGESEQAGRLHALAGQLAYHLDDETTAVEEFERAIAVAERLGDERTVATSRCYYGAVLLVTGDVERGAEMARLAAEAAARLAIYPLAAESLSVLAISHAVAGDFANEREMHVARLAVAREHGDVARTADALGVLAEVALDEADSAGARAFAEESLAIAEPTLPMEACVALAVLARADVVEGDLPSAVATLGRAFAAAEKIGQRLMLAQCYRVAGAIAAARGSASEAVRLYAAAQRLSPSPSGTDDPVEADLLGGLETARSALARDVVEREWTLGTSLPGARVRALLNDVLDTTTTAAAR
jgi:predicted ATPase/DNA-binding SARP family transcriptional activator